MKRILTGLKPSGALTLGNYIGSIKQMIEYQEKYESYLFIADMHAITVPQDPTELSKNIRELLAIYIACGFDPEKNTIFLQSENIYHANTSWILECLTPYGHLGRMTQFKDKSQKHENFSAGLLTYPVLMASDILLYDIDYVPVGIDQQQHVEFTRDLAQIVNRRYGKEFFKLPEALMPKEGEKIKDLINPTKKMSKSDQNKNGSILLLDSEEDILRKIMGATTDSEMKVRYDKENKPGISNLMTIYSVLSNLSIKEVEEKFKDTGYGEFKREVANVVIKTLKPIQDRYYQLLKSKELDKILDDGIKKTSKIAEKKYLELKQMIGIHR